jgi:hypothetical protein
MRVRVGVSIKLIQRTTHDQSKIFISFTSAWF